MASGTTYFDNTVGVDALVSYSGGAVTLPATSSVAAITATTLNAPTNTGTAAAAQPGTTLTAAGTFAPTFASGYLLMNVASGTNSAFVLTTTGLKIGGIYTAINQTVPAAGTFTLTTSAGTFYSGQSAGTVLKFAAANMAATFQVLASTRFQLLSNVGTVVIA
jgi:hypothetical protein